MGNSLQAHITTVPNVSHKDYLKTSQKYSRVMLQRSLGYARLKWHFAVLNTSPTFSELHDA